MRLRGAVNVAIYNTAVRDFNTGCIRIDDADANERRCAEFFSDVTLVNVLGACTPGGFYDQRAANTEINAVPSGVTVDASYALTDAAATVAAHHHGGGQWLGLHLRQQHLCWRRRAWHSGR